MPQDSPHTEPETHTETDDDAPSESAGHVEVVGATSDDTGGDGDGPNESVTRPSKLIRIASMVRNMLEEVRRAPLDEDGRRLLRDIHERSLHELEEVLSEDLRAELAEVVFPFSEETPSESQLRIAQAQLVGWLEGLFHGIQATIFSQQMSMQQQLDEMRQRKALEAAQSQRPPGAYL